MDVLANVHNDDWWTDFTDHKAVPELCTGDNIKIKDIKWIYWWNRDNKTDEHELWQLYEYKYIFKKIYKEKENY